MLQQENRLKKTRDIEITFEEGYFVGGSLLNLKVWKVDPKKYPKRGYTGEELKFAFVVGTKIDKRSVIRNRLKRQMREVVRLLLQKSLVTRGFFILVMAKKEMVNATYSDIEKDLLASFRRARVL